MTSQLTVDLVGRKPISANSGLKFNLGFLFVCSKAFSRTIFTILDRASINDKFSCLNLYFALTLSYLNPALNNPNLVPRALFSLALGVGREKALASTGHMTTKHPEFVSVLN